MWLINLYRNAFQGLSTNTWILAITVLINRVGSMVLLFAPLFFTKDLGFTMSESGFAMGAYGIGGILGSYQGGSLSDKYNFVKIMMITLIIAGLFMVPLFFIKTYVPIVVILFCIGFFSDMFRPANSLAIAAYSTPETRTRSFSLIRLAANLGFGIGPAIGGIMAATIGFKWVFLFDALTCILAALLVYIYLPISSGIKIQRTEENEGKQSENLSAYRDKTFLLFILMVCVYGICFFQLFASVPLYFSRELHFDEKTIGYLLALNGLLVVLLEMPIISKLETYHKPMRLVAFGCLMMVMCFPFLFITSFPIIACIIYTILITFAEIFAMPFMSNYAVSRPHDSRRGQYMALYSIAYGLAITVAPTFGLSIADNFGFSVLYPIIIGISLVLAFFFYRLDN